MIKALVSTATENTDYNIQDMCLTKGSWLECFWYPYWYRTGGGTTSTSIMVAIEGPVDAAVEKKEFQAPGILLSSVWIWKFSLAHQHQPWKRLIFEVSWLSDGSWVLSSLAQNGQSLGLPPYTWLDGRTILHYPGRLLSRHVIIQACYYPGRLLSRQVIIQYYYLKNKL